MFNLQINDDVEVPRATSSSNTEGSPDGCLSLGAFTELSPGGRSSSGAEWSPGCHASPSEILVRWSPDDQTSTQAFHTVILCYRFIHYILASDLETGVEAGLFGRLLFRFI